MLKVARLVTGTPAKSAPHMPPPASTQDWRPVVVPLLPGMLPARPKMRTAGESQGVGVSRGAECGYGCHPLKRRRKDSEGAPLTPRRLVYAIQLSQRSGSAQPGPYPPRYQINFLYDF